jgi:anti-anti-sigma factor
MPVMDVLLGDISYTLGVGPGHTFLRVAGNFCGSNTPKLSSVFQRSITHLRGKLFLSLQGCYSIDSQGLAFLVQQSKNLGDRCRDVVLVDVPTGLLNALDGSHLTSLFETFPSLEEAEKKYGHAVA